MTDSPTNSTRRRSWLPSLLLALVIFGSGAAVGSGGTFFYLGRIVHGCASFRNYENRSQAKHKQ